MKQIVLTMSQEDFQLLLPMIRSCRGWRNADGLLGRIKREVQEVPDECRCIVLTPRSGKYCETCGGLVEANQVVRDGD